MKLKNLLTESSTEFDFDYTEKLRDEVTDALNDTFKSLAPHGFKIEEYTEEPDSSTFGVVLTNKMFDLTLEIDISPGSNPGSERYDFFWQLSISDAYAVGNGQTFVTTIASGNIARTDDSEILTKAVIVAQHRLEKMMKPLIDWYFDVTGEYGKVKMFVEKRGAEDTIRALAGDFKISVNQGEVY